MRKKVKNEIDLADKIKDGLRVITDYIMKGANYYEWKYWH